MDSMLGKVFDIVIGPSWVPTITGYIIAAAILHTEWKSAISETRPINADKIVYATASAAGGRATRQVNKSSEDHNVEE